MRSVHMGPPQHLRWSSYTTGQELIGLCSFVHTTDPSTVCCIYHATGSPTDGWANRKAHVCILGPETFVQNRTAICGVTASQHQKQMESAGAPQADLQAHSSATQGHGQLGYPGGPQAQAQTQGRHGFFEKMQNRLRRL